MTNRLPALRKCWRIYGVHGAGEDKCILDADLSAQTSEPQPRRLTPCTPAACCQCGNEKFGGNGTPREFTPPTRTKVFSTGVSVIVMHEDVSQCSAALDTHTSTCWGAAGGQGWAHMAPRRLAGLPAELGCPQCMCSLLFHLWGSLSAKEHLHVCSALSWPRSLSDCTGFARGLLEMPRKQRGRQGRLEKNEEQEKQGRLKRRSVK